MEILRLLELLDFYFSYVLLTNDIEEFLAAFTKRQSSYLGSFAIVHNPTNHCLRILGLNGDIVRLMEPHQTSPQVIDLTWANLKDRNPELLLLCRWGVYCQSRVTERDLIPYLPGSNFVSAIASEHYVINSLGVSPEAQLSQDLGSLRKGTVFRFDPQTIIPPNTALEPTGTAPVISTNRWNLEVTVAVPSPAPVPAAQLLDVRHHWTRTVIRWHEPDVAEFFGVDAKFHEPLHSYSFELARDGLRFLLTLFDLEGAVYVSIWRDGLPDPLFTIVRESCTHARLATDMRGRSCLEVGSPEHPTTDMGIPPLLDRGVRVYVEPQFRVEFIDVEPRGDA